MPGIGSWPLLGLFSLMFLTAGFIAGVYVANSEHYGVG